MTRIQVANDDAGAGAYTFAVNPSFFDTQDTPNINNFDSLYSGKIYSKLSFDNRVRFFTWEGFPVDRSDINSIIAYFRPKEGQIKYFNFQDLEEINERWPTSDTWKKARIIAIETISRKGGKLVYETVTLRIQPEK